MTDKAKRPLSPHLQVYKPQMTSVGSILHRATGYALAVGLVLFTWWLVAAATGPEAYDTFKTFCASGIGLIMLFGWTLAFFYHLANGLRHLIWDSGFLFKIEHASAAGWFVLLFTVVMTYLSWACLYGC